MGIPLTWHKRQAMLLASQLPENPDDAYLVVQAITDLLDKFLIEGPADKAGRAANVLPFATG